MSLKYFLEAYNQRYWMRLRRLYFLLKERESFDYSVIINFFTSYTISRNSTWQIHSVIPPESINNNVRATILRIRSGHRFLVENVKSKLVFKAELCTQEARWKLASLINSAKQWPRKVGLLRACDKRWCRIWKHILLLCCNKDVNDMWN